MFILAAPLALLAVPSAQAQYAHHHVRHHVAQADVGGDRPLTIGGHRRYGPIYRRGNEIIAPGGFSAHGYGFGDPGSEEARRAFRNADIRERTNGLYGSGFDGLGGTQLFGDHGESGYDNPSWGNAFSTYVGYNGVPTALAFGPGYASRYITDHEPEDDDRDTPWPSPADLGFSPAPGFGAPVGVVNDDDN